MVCETIDPVKQSAPAFFYCYGNWRLKNQSPYDKTAQTISLIHTLLRRTIRLPANVSAISSGYPACIYYTLKANIRSPVLHTSHAHMRGFPVSRRFTVLCRIETQHPLNRMACYKYALGMVRTNWVRNENINSKSVQNHLFHILPHVMRNCIKNRESSWIINSLGQVVSLTAKNPHQQVQTCIV